MDKRICVFGGTSLYRLPIYNQMAKELGCDFYLLQEESSAGIKSYNKEDLINYRDTIHIDYKFGNFFWSKNVLRLIKFPYDVYVLGGAYWVTSWFLILLARIHRKKIATWSHGLYGRESGFRRLVKKVFFKLADINFVYNNCAVKLMVQNGIPKEKVVCVGNSLDSDHDLCVRQKLVQTDLIKHHFGNDLPTLIFVGRVTNEKRLDLILLSMDILRKEGLHVNLIVVGKDVDGVNLEEVAAKLKLTDRLWMYGPCYDENIIGELFYNSPVCVSPGNIGLTAISSMTFGCPVITHDDFNYQGPEYEAVIPGVTGDFFRRLDTVDLAEVIKRWTSEDVVGRREDIRNACFNEVDAKWTIYSETKAFVNAFENLK